MDEHVLAEADGIYRWEGPKRKATLFSAKLGRVVLTDRRLLFLSTGKHDVTAGKLLGGAVGGAALVRALGTADTGHLDVAALGNEGGLSVPLELLTAFELKGAFKVMTIGYRDGDREVFTTFAPKNGGMPSGPAWIDAIGRARAQLPAGGAA